MFEGWFERQGWREWLGVRDEEVRGGVSCCGVRQTSRP